MLLVILLLTMPKSAAADAAQGPVLSVPSPQLQFGRVTNGMGIQLEYPLRNDGAEELILNQILPDCPLCIHATAKPARLKPGQQGVLSVQFDFLGQTGPLSHVITLESNDPSRPTTLLSFSGEAVRTFQLSPAELRLQVRRGETNASVLLRSLDPLPPPPSGGRIVTESLQASIQPVSPNEWRVTVTLTKTPAIGTTRTTLEIPAAGPGDHARHIPCTLINPPDIEVLPETLRLPDAPTPSWETIWIRQHSPAPTQLIEVSPTSRNIQCEVIPQPGTPNYRIRARTTEAVSNGSAPSTLILRFAGNGGPGETVEIPVRWFPAAEPGR